MLAALSVILRLVGLISWADKLWESHKAKEIANEPAKELEIAARPPASADDILKRMSDGSE